MLTVTLTPTMIVFENLDDETAEKLDVAVDVKINDSGQYYAKGNPTELYKVLLHLTYTYDIELT